MSEWQPKILIFLCQWSLKPETEWVQRFNLPYGARVVEVPCSGRVNPLLILSTLQHGADGVLVVGCEPGHCHYKEGNYLGRRKFVILKNFLEYIGLDEGRVCFAWVRESDRGKLRALVEDLLHNVQRLGPNRKLATREALPYVIQTR